MSPARMAKSAPVIPNVEPPLSAYLQIVSYSLVAAELVGPTGRRHVALGLKPR